MLYRYILALTLSAMCTVNGEEVATTAPSVMPTTPSASPTNAPTTTQTAYLISATQTLPCCVFVEGTTVTADNKCGETGSNACDADTFAEKSSFEGKAMDVTVAEPVKSGATCTCEYSFKRLEYKLVDAADGYAKREMVSSDRWPNLVTYAEWKNDKEATLKVNDIGCNALYVTDCPASKECAGNDPKGDAAANLEQLPATLAIGESTTTLVDWGKSMEYWPTADPAVSMEICYCFWLYRDLEECPPTPAPTASPQDDVMTTVVDDDDAEETGGAANHSLAVAAVLLAASAIFTAL